MTARILNGNEIREHIYAELAREIADLDAAGVKPGLAAVLVGDNPASHIYVKSKIAACKKLGLASRQETPPRKHHDTGSAPSGRASERARRRGRHPRAIAVAAAGGREENF